MSPPRRLTVRHKLSLLLVIILAVFVTSHAVQESTLDRFQVGGPVHQQLKLQAETYDTVQALLGELHAARAVLHLMLAPSSEDGARLLVKQWEEIASGVDARFEQALSVTDAPDARLYVEDARVAWEGYARAVRTRVFAVSVAERSRVLADFLAGAHTRRYARLAELLEAAANSLRLRSSELELEVARRLRRARWGLAAVDGGLGLFLLVFLAAVGRSITRPLKELMVAARQVEQGDLSLQLATSGEDEIGQLSRILGQMVSHLRELMLAVRQAGQEMAEAVERLAGAADEQGRSIERQAAAVTRTNAVAEEISQTSELAERQVAGVLSTAERADEVGRSGMEVLTGSLRGIQDLRGQFDAIARHVVELAEHSVKVSTLTETVRDLAEQSHVLALSAGIEAARAGPEGQGFRVVAVEIRSLADRSVKETVAVREQLRRSSGAMRNTVAITARGRARMEEELEQVRTGGERLEELTRMLQESSISLRSIVQVVKQQHQGLGQIFSAVNELSRTTDKAVVSVAAMRQSAEQLRSTTARLTEALSGFRL
ncbi:methyl-accepting chemotaxis protein [Cystobacter fuscus]|uniref:methyl-accepting chemotaxis protein n=1 Tax=Cystobacter fuscus TaxID=43 RepID=UPI002B31D8FB|nr:methyl-accepting chemotaxis protein [Cystobacter fuscus]